MCDNKGCAPVHELFERCQKRFEGSGAELSFLTEAEMADALGVSRGTVKSHVSRGLDALAALLEETR